MKTVKFNFDIDEKVETPIGKGIIQSLYVDNTNTKGAWILLTNGQQVSFREDQLKRNVK